MKFKINSQLLFSIIKKIIKINSPNPLNEIYKNLKVEVQKDKIFFYCLNEKIFLKTLIEKNDENLEIQKEGSFLINLKILYEILNKLKNEVLLFEMKINNLIITNFNNKNSFIFKLNTIAIEKFPQIDFDITTNSKIILPKKIIEEINNQVNFVIDVNNSTAVLRGINFIFSPNNLIITATDRISMAQKKLIIKNDSLNKEITIPTGMLNDIDKITNDLNEDYNFYLNDEQNLLIEIANFWFKGRMITGQYPKVQNVINNFLTDSKNDVIIINDLKSFLSTIELAVVLAKKDMIPLVELMFDQTNKIIEIICVSNNNSYGEIHEQFTNFETINTINKEIVNLTITFNYYLFIYALKSFSKCSKVTLNISPNKHTIITSEDDLTLVQLVLPIIKN